MLSLPIQTRELVVERLLGLLLGARFEAGVDAQARLGEVLVVIVAPQGAAHEVEVRGVIRTRRAAADTERLVRGRARLPGSHDPLVGHDLEDQVAARPRALGVAPRIVIRGSADHRDQQRHFRQVELRERLAEIELAGEAKAVNRAVAVLTEEDLVDVRVHEIGLGEVRIQRHRHDRFTHLARQRLPRTEEVAAHQLLRERAAALLDLAGAHVDPQRAQHRDRVDAVMAVELAVLDRLERGGQERGHFLRCDDDAILAVDRKNAADEQRLEPQHRYVPAGAVAQALEPLGTRDDAQQLRVARLVREARRPQRNVEARAGHAVGAGTLGPLGAPVVQALQLLLELRRRQRQSRVQLQRRPSNCRVTRRSRYRT